LSTNLNVLYSSNNLCDGKPANKARSKTLRHIPSAPTRILDAPDLLDDYYLNLISWSSKNIIAVALGPAVYLAVGTSGAETQLWDTSKLKQVRSMNGHSDRISSLAWNQHTLTSGSKDSSIVNHDVRVRDHNVATLSGHTQEVCGLQWNSEGTQLASGGNDNLLCIWVAAAASSSSSRRQAPRFSLAGHQSAVKAIAWSPHERNLLATGGGTADRCIKFWNTETGGMLNSIDTGSQVCSLLWNPHEKEILSSHGFSKNELCLWNYPSMLKVKELSGHTERVLHLAVAPEGGQVCSAGADETLRFWDVFGEPPETKKVKAAGQLSAVAMSKFPMSIR